MLEAAKHDFRTTELDLELLSTPFRVQTNWHVITGASCSGKTTLINQLADQGFQTSPESARQYFESELSKGRTMDEIRENRAALTRQILGMMVKVESGLEAAEVTFLDRALPDGLAYFRFAGMDPNELLPDCFQHRYVSVFMLDRFPYQRDGVRSADDETAAYFEAWMYRDYIALGYSVIRVPVLPLEERLGFVFERLSEDKLL